MIEEPHRIRLVASADWHFRERVANEAELDLLLEAMASTTPDVVLLLGDLVGWHRPTELRIVFNALAGLRCPVGVVFGNHDVWLEDSSGPSSSWEALRSFCNLAAAAGLHPLDLEPLRLHQLFLCGSGAWYDYSLGNPGWTEEEYAAKRSADAIWNDALHVRWGMPDREVCERLCGQLDRQLARAPEGTEPVVATHMAALSGSLPLTSDPVWSYYSAFWGSRRLAEVIQRHRVRLHLHGHIHGEKRAIPKRAVDDTSSFTSYNASYSVGRHFLICDWSGIDSGWNVREGLTER